MNINKKTTYAFVFLVTIQRNIFCCSYFNSPEDCYQGKNSKNINFVFENNNNKVEAQNKQSKKVEEVRSDFNLEKVSLGYNVNDLMPGQTKSIFNL